MLPPGCVAAAQPWHGGPAEEPPVAIAMTGQVDTIRLSVAPGTKPGSQIVLEFADGSRRTLSLATQAQAGKRRMPAAADAPKDAKPLYEEVQVEDSFVAVSGLNLRLFARPNLARYTDAQQDGLLRNWASLPAASQTFIAFEFRRAHGRPEMWINGSFAGVVATTALRQVRTVLQPGAAIQDAAACTRPAVAETFCVLDIGRLARPGALREAKVSIAAGPGTVGGVPFVVAEGAGNADVGVVREMKGSWALECDEHLSRTPFDGMPEQLHFSVPRAFYHKAYMLCAAEPDPGKDPVLTVRMTRFGNSGRAGEAMSHATVRLPRSGETPAANLKRVGSISWQKDGTPVEAPLFLATLDLHGGVMLDLLQPGKDPHAAMLGGGYLDIDLLGRMDGIKPAKDSVSGVHIFGLTLEKSPVEFTLEPRQPGNIFRSGDVLETVAVIKAVEPCRVTLAWRITDVAGRHVREDGVHLNFASAGEEKRERISLKAPRVGWYGLRFSLAPRRDPDHPFLVHDAAFALLAPDRRKAGYESPYGVWWFGGAHYGCDDVATIGPLLNKAGYHKTTFGWTKATEAEFAPWQVTLNQIGWMYRTNDPAGSERKIADLAAKFPHCKSILIFHESYGNYLPAELFGEKPREDALTVEAARNRVKTATGAARLYRGQFPGFQIIAGNTSASAAIIASLFRHGFDASLMDFIGIETAAGQTGMPEKLWEGGPQGAYLSREVAKRFGHDVPVTGCYEYTARCERNLGAQRHAEFYVRDVLMAHAYDYRHISPGLLFDTGNAYANTLWGAGGLCRRHPLLYPKPAYVAMASLTAALDQVQFRRKIPTGSLTVYVLEFDRADGRYAYAAWTPRAPVDLALEFPPGTQLEHSDFYGAVSSPRLRSGRLTLAAGPAPFYLTSTKPLAAIRVARHLAGKAPDAFRVADRLDDASAWTLERDESLVKRTGELPLHVMGRFSMRSVDDAERGRCLELELHGDGTLSDYIGEYGTIACTNSAPLPGTPHTVGLWVRGNSSWGKIVFEFEDAAGCVWRTHAREWHDWQGELSINFDGWQFIQFPLDERSPVVYSSPGGRCQRIKGGNASVTHPVRFTKFHVIMNRKALDPTEFQVVSPVIRLSSAGGY